MKLLILEFITGGGFVGTDLPESLIAEAQIMLNAIVGDMQGVEDVRLKIMRDARLSNRIADDDGEKYDCILVSSEPGFHAIWQQTLDQVDAVLVIAPETDAVLACLCADVEDAGKLLLNSDSDVVRLTSSKLDTCKHLQADNIPVIDTQRLGDSVDFSGPWVVKPDDGVGCSDIYLVDEKQLLQTMLQSSRLNNLVIQPWIPGQAASLSVIFYENGAQLLTYNKQLIEIQQGRIHLIGCRVGEQTKYWEFYQSLVMRISNSLPGLKGYVGIDVIETEHGPVVVEINPRLTTSYAGLSKALGINPAELILKRFDQDISSSLSKYNETSTPVSIDLCAFYEH